MIKFSYDKVPMNFEFLQQLVAKFVFGLTLLELVLVTQIQSSEDGS
jgi:hypothetical protein